MNCLSPTRVNSKAVVRYAEMGLPVPLNMVAENTDLRYSMSFQELTIKHQSFLIKRNCVKYVLLIGIFFI